MATNGTTTTTTSTTTTPAPKQPRDRDRDRTRDQDDEQAQDDDSEPQKKPYEVATEAFALNIPTALNDKVESVEVEFVHDGKGEFKAPSVSGFTGAKVTERVQQAAPPHAIVVVRAKKPETNEDTGVRSESRVLDAYGVAPTYTVNGISGLALGERNSIPLLGTLPAGDAPKAVAEGVVATG